MTTNAREFGIEMTSIPKRHLRNVLQALLHSIFFHRLLVNVKPRELNVLDTTVSITDSWEVEALIEEKTNEFLSSLQDNTKQGKIAVLFYEKKSAQNWFQITRTEELVCWERWTLALGLAQDSPGSQDGICGRQLSRCLLEILKMANDHKENVPSITTIDGNPFPYRIVIPSRSESWSAMMRRLLVTDTLA